MGEKILTVSVAAYNMEPYIRQTLDSLIVPEILDKLEVFVVDDGGTDGTLEIAKEYETKYPDTFHAVHKENGGYGSTVNWSLAHATGKYFKLLDGDDWFDEMGVLTLVRLLETVNTDIVITPYYKCIDGKKESKRSSTVNNLDMELNTDYPLINMKVDRVFGMWAITYKTLLLKESKMELPLHCLYTDQIYSTIPFAFAKTIRFVDAYVYCYRTGRDGQSVSKESRIKHTQEKARLSLELSEFYETQKERNGVNTRYLCRRIAAYDCGIIKAYLLQPVSADVLFEIEQFDRQIKRLSPDLYRSMVDFRAHKKIAPYLRLMRLWKYGGIGLAISKLILPKDGIESWA